MSQQYEIKLSCSCGAQLVYMEHVSEAYYSHTGYERSAFLEAHKVCREKPKVNILQLPKKLEK